MKKSTIFTDSIDDATGKIFYKMQIPEVWRPVFSRYKPKGTLSFDFKVSKVVNTRRIAKVINTMPTELLGGTLTDMALPHVYDKIDDIIYVIACAIQNNQNEPTAKLISILRNNLDHDDMIEAYNVSIAQMGLDSFIQCFIIIRGAGKVLNPDPDEVTQNTPDTETKNTDS